MENNIVLNEDELAMLEQMTAQETAINGPYLPELDWSGLPASVTLTAWFMGLYMGGHTLKDAFGKWAGRT